MIDTSAKTLLGIINDVLDISKIEASKMILQEKRFSIRQLALEVINLLKLKADSKGIRLTCNISDEIPEYLMGDPLRIRQILFNLLGNSVKFTEHGVVEISAELLESDLSTVKLLFKVKDTGIGIPEERLNVIFEEFTQSDPSITQKYGGTGLGLTIVKKLVNLMGGSISVESSVNVGSLFQFELILGKAVPSDTSDKVERQDFNRFSEEYLELKPMKIAVAEDNIINQKYITSLLKYYGFEVALAENGKEVINLIS
jgi:signal transduction histidine kinase